MERYSPWLRACCFWLYCGTFFMTLPTGSFAQAPVAPAKVEEPVLKAYEVAGRDPNVVAAALQQQLPANAGISIAANARNGTVLVLAPPSVQQLVAQLMQAPAAQPVAGQPNATSPNSAPPPAAAELQRVERVLTLQHLPADRFESALATLVNRRLPSTTDDSGQLATLTLTGRDQTATLLTIDRKSGRITISGRPALVEAWSRVTTTLDKSVAPASTTAAERAVMIRNPDIVTNGSLQRALQLIGEQVGPRAEQPNPNKLVSMLFQPRPEAPAPAAQPGKQPAQQPPANPADEGTGGLSGPVEIIYNEALDMIFLKGAPKDVERLQQIIEEIEKASVESVPELVIHPLQHVTSDAMASLVRSLYEQILSPRQGRVSITSLVKPNSLLLIGRKESVESVIKLIKQLDVEVDPSGEFKIFELKHTAANEVLQTVQALLSGQTVGGTAGTGTNQLGTTTTAAATITAPGLGTRAVLTADYRTNSLIVRAGKRDLAEIEALINQIDKPSSAAVNDLRVFNLKYSLAEELAPVLQSAISGTAQQTRNQGQNQNQNQQNPFQQLQNNQQNNQNQQQNAQQRAARSIMLQFLTVDTQGKKLLKSGLLTDVRITADGRANAVIVSAPNESMELIAALIQELDQMPTAEAQIKVFTIKNGDAANLVTMLQSLFGLATTGNAAGGQRGATGGANFNFAGGDTSGDNPLVGLRFSVDQRTNSIIVSGSAGDLNVVEAILLRLDESDVRQRKSTVYRLKNAPALDVANSINQLLSSERQLQQVAPQSLSPFEQIEKEVVVVPEQVSNSLIISATPRYFDEIRLIIEQLDMRPPMVMIQVLIAEVQLANNDEFGVELGVQDSVLFDRSLLGDLVTTTETTTFGNPATTVQNQTIQAATNTPGFNFNNQPLGNSGSTQALNNSRRVGSQGLSSFALGRTNSQLGFGGLVLSASSESLSVLLRALSANRRLEVLSRPQIMTLDNQPAFIQVGQRVPRITNVSVNLGIQNNSVQLENVGLILGVTPRISPDGLVVMEIDAEKSEVGPEAEGVPIFVNTTGEVIRSPRFNTSVAQTTVSAANGQTIILGGLISKSKQDFSRRAPFLSDIPVLGHFFRYDSTSSTRNELLIIMTPRIVRTQQDAELIKQVESARMSWCLADVIRMHGPSGLKTRKDHWGDNETLVIYPDQDPHGEGMPIHPEGTGPAEAVSPEEEIRQSIQRQLPPGAQIQGEHSIPGESGKFTNPIPDVLPAPGTTPGSSRRGGPAVRSASDQPSGGAGPTMAPSAASAPPQPANSLLQAWSNSTQPATAQPVIPAIAAPTAPSVIPATWNNAPTAGGPLPAASALPSQGVIPAGWNTIPGVAPQAVLPPIAPLQTVPQQAMPPAAFPPINPAAAQPALLPSPVQQPAGQLNQPPAYLQR